MLGKRALYFKRNSRPCHHECAHPGRDRRASGSKSINAWEARFELAYEKCKDENVTLLGGVAPVAVRFARYSRKKHKVYPKDLWQTQIMTLGSIHGINTRYQPKLQALYGTVAIRGTAGGATECMFGQQRDEKRTSRTRPDLDTMSKHRLFRG
jgi:hypothetical protein